jgi:AcrR family transcriptional regulator
MTQYGRPDRAATTRMSTPRSPAPGHDGSRDPFEEGSRTGAAQTRLHDAVPGAAERHGLVGLTVEHVLELAGVSRASFYQYHSSLQEWFWSGYRLRAERLLRDVRAVVAKAAEPELAMLAVLAQVAFERPGDAWLLMAEGLAAGPVCTERDVLVAEIERALAVAPARAVTVDLPPAILIGAVFRFISMRLLDGALGDALGDEACEWAASFARSTSEPSWSAGLMPVLEDRPARRPNRRPGGALRGTPRERLLAGMAATVRQRGFRQTTVADVVAAAGVSRRSFYNEFQGKAAAFVAAYENGFQQALAAAAPAFFSATAWPERVWRSADAFTGYLAREPDVAYLGFVECYALGRGFAPRVHETQQAFTMFLEEGFRQHEGASQPARACSALTTAAIAETCFRASRGALASGIRQLQPLAAYIVLTPFIGFEQAARFVARKVAASASDAPAVWSSHSISTRR